MAQVTFTADTTPSLADLDANFTELYQLRNLFVVANGGAGLGSTPVDVDGQHMQIGYRTHLFHLNVNGAGYFTSGLTFDGVDWRYDVAGYGAIVQVNGGDGSVSFSRAPSGLAGAAATVSETLRLDAAGAVTPGADNAQALGSGSKRWSVVYAGTGTINTSDAREKTAVAPMSTGEIAAAKQLASEIGTYRFLDAIAAKGDAARTHVGMTVQRAIEVMESHGLDPMRYGFICYDEFVGGDRYSFRPDELLMFLMRGVEARLTAAGL